MLKLKDVKKIYKKLDYMENLTETEKKVYETLNYWYGDEAYDRLETALRVLDELKSDCGGVEYV